jgi:centrosomal CEP192-like protein
VVGDNPDQIITVTNNDEIPAGIRLISKTGSTAFTFTKTCGTILAAGASCTVDVTFTVPAVGSYSGSLNVYESAGAIHKIPLSGTGVTGN